MQNKTKLAKTCWQSTKYIKKTIKVRPKTLICVLADLFYFVYEILVPSFYFQDVVDIYLLFLTLHREPPRPFRILIKDQPASW